MNSLEALGWSLGLGLWKFSVVALLALVDDRDKRSLNRCLAKGGTKSVLLS